MMPDGRQLPADWQQQYQSKSAPPPADFHGMRLNFWRLDDTGGGGGVGVGGPEESIRNMLGRHNLGVGRRGGDPSGDVLGGERAPPVSDRGVRPSAREARGVRHRGIGELPVRAWAECSLASDTPRAGGPTKIQRSHKHDTAPLTHLAGHTSLLSRNRKPSAQPGLKRRNVRREPGASPLRPGRPGLSGNALPAFSAPLRPLATASCLSCPCPHQARPISACSCPCPLRAHVRLAH